MKKPLYIFLLLVCCAVSSTFCQNDEGGGKADPRSFCETDIRYFPIAMFSRHKEKWFSGHLAEMNEPSILKGTNTSIRITILRTWGGNTTIRLQRQQANECTLDAKEFDGGNSTGWRAGKQIVRAQKAIVAETFTSIEEQVSRFFSKRNPTATDPRGLSGADGETWILEYQSGKEYFVVSRWSPDIVLENISKGNSGHREYRDEYRELVKIHGHLIRYRAKTHPTPPSQGGKSRKRHPGG